VAKMNLQFHGTTDEIIELVRRLQVSYNLHMVTIKLFPFEYKTISQDEFESKIEVIRDSKMIFLRLDKPDLTQTEYMKFLDDNNNSLVISLGKYREGLMEESSIGTIATDSNALVIWKKIINAYRRKLLKGAWIGHVMSDTKTFYKNHYYTPLAQEAFLGGYKIVQFESLPSFYILSYDIDIYKDYNFEPPSQLEI